MAPRTRKQTPAADDADQPAATVEEVAVEETEDGSFVADDEVVSYGGDGERVEEVTAVEADQAPDAEPVKDAPPFMSEGVRQELVQHGKAFDHNGGCWLKKEGAEPSYLPRGTWRADRAGNVTELK